MNLLEQSLWWIVPAFLIAGFMVFAMMEFTALLMERPSRRRKHPLSGTELRERLLALNDPLRPYRLVEGGRADLEVAWDVVDASWYELFAKVKLSSRYHARMLLDAERHQVRWYESLRTSTWFIGFEGWKLRFNGSIEWRGGYIDILWRGFAYGILSGFPPRIGKVYAFELDTISMKDEVADVISNAGWDFRPAPHALKVNRRRIDLVRALRPAWLGRISERWLWGTLYAGSFILFYVYVLVAIVDAEAGDYTWTNLWPAVVVGLGWWVTWAGIAWLLTRGARLRRRQKAKEGTT